MTIEIEIQRLVNFEIATDGTAVKLIVTDIANREIGIRRDSVRLRLTASMSVRSRDARDGHRLQKVGFAGIEKEPNGSVIERPPLGQSVGD
jgi:hypothetical protein